MAKVPLQKDEGMRKEAWRTGYLVEACQLAAWLWRSCASALLLVAPLPSAAIIGLSRKSDKRIP